MTDIVTDKIAPLLTLGEVKDLDASQVKGGDIEVGTAVVKKGDNGDAFCEISLEVHLYPVIDNLLAQSIKGQIESEQTSMLLLSSLQHQASGFSKISFTSVQLSDFDILTAADRLPYIPSGGGTNGVPCRLPLIFCTHLLCISSSFQQTVLRSRLQPLM
jgi:hypothetical protein